MEVLRNGKFSLSIKSNELIRGIRSSSNQVRNKNTFSAMSGMIGRDGGLISQTTLSPIDTSSLVASFPFPQIFVLTNMIIVCTLTKIYEYDGSSLVLKLTTTSGSTWKVVDFFDYVYMSNEVVAVVRSAETKAYSVSAVLDPFVSVCNYNGQVMIGSPNTAYTDVAVGVSQISFGPAISGTGSSS